MMNPFRAGFYAVQLFSHKVMRYAVPFFLIAVFASTAVLSFYALFYALIFAGQVLFYGAALASWLLSRCGKEIKILALPHYFVLANLASLKAMYQFARGERYASWNPIREGVQPAEASKS
jgi:hypothetical protein